MKTSSQKYDRFIVFNFFCHLLLKHMGYDVGQINCNIGLEQERLLT